MTDSQLKPVEAINLKGLAGIRHGFFTREGGASAGIYAGLNCGIGSSDDTATVLENRAAVASHLNAAWPQIVTLYQIHSAEARVVEEPIAREALPKADAVVTRTKGLAVGVLTADCTPVLFAEPEAGVVAAAHAGWRGAVGGILEAAIEAMEDLGASRARIVAAVGPTINPAAYEVGEDFVASVTQADESTYSFIYQPREIGNKPHFDLPGYVEARLSRAGLSNIERQTLCTYEGESRFYSFRRTTHRKEPDYGRQISAIVVT